MLERYAAYGDAVLGRWGARKDGSPVPGVRAVAKPLLGLFHGEPGGRRFRVALEDGLSRKPATLSALLQARSGVAGLLGFVCIGGRSKNCVVRCLSANCA